MSVHEYVGALTDTNLARPLLHISTCWIFLALRTQGTGRLSKITSFYRRRLVGSSSRGDQTLFDATLPATKGGTLTAIGMGIQRQRWDRPAEGTEGRALPLKNHWGQKGSLPCKKHLELSGKPRSFPLARVLPGNHGVEYSSPSFCVVVHVTALIAGCFRPALRQRRQCSSLRRKPSD